MTIGDIVDGVRAHALDNYETGGWDILVECYGDEEIAALVAGATTLDEAIAIAAESLGHANDYRAEIEATAF